MAKPPSRYKLKLSRLDFVSPVDTPAQETAKVLLTKRADEDALEFSAFAPVVKTVETTDDDGQPIGLVFCWAFTEKSEGVDYHDLQGDQVLADDNMIRAALDYVKRGAQTDQMHDGVPDGFAPFVMPMNAQIATAFFGKTVDTSGLMIGLAPSADVFAKFQSGEYTGVSIQGLGQRDAIKAVRSANPDHFDETGDSWRYRVRPPGQFQADSFRTIPLGKDTGVKAVVGKFPGNDVEHIQTLIFAKDTFKTKASAAAWIHKNPDVLRQPHTKRADVEKVIRKLPDGQYGLFTADGKKLLSKHPTKADAQKQENAIHAHENDMGKRFAKGLVLLTSETDGHQHAIELNRWRYPTTTYGTSEGADQGHCHAWTVDATGKVTIGADSGHSHDVEGLVPADILACWNDDEDAVCEPITDEKSSGATVVVVTARANSTPTPAAKQAVTTTEKTMSTEQQIADLTKRAERAEKLATLTDAQRAHYSKLGSADGEAYLAKSATERDAVLAEIEKSNEVVYTSTTDGTVYRKSDDRRLVEMAKRQDAQAVDLAKAKSDREHEVLKRRVRDEIGHLAGSDDAKIALLKAATGIADEKLRGEVVEALKAADAVMKDLGSPRGSSNDGADNAPVAKMQAALAEFAKGKGKTPEAATADFIKTQEGAALYAEAFPFKAN